MSSQKRKSNLVKNVIEERAKALRQLPEFLSSSEVFIKEEPTNDSPSVTTANRRTTPNVSFCRCCFKVIDYNQASLLNPDKVAQTLEEMIHRPVAYSPSTQYFCVDCYNFIGSYKQFRNLATARQEKLKTMLANNCEDYSEIFFYDADDVRKETVNDEYHSQDIPEDEDIPENEQIESNDSFNDNFSDDSFDYLPAPSKKSLSRPKDQKVNKSTAQLDPQMEVEISRENFELIYDFNERGFLGRQGQPTAKWPVFYKCIKQVMNLRDGWLVTQSVHNGARETAISTILRVDGHKSKCGKYYRIQTKTEKIFSENPITFLLKHVSTKCFCPETSSSEKDEKSSKRRKCQDSDDEKD